MDDSEPEVWVLEDDELEDESTPAAEQVDLDSTLTSDDVAGDDWADTAWLDELPSSPVGERPSRADGAGDLDSGDERHDATPAAEFSSLFTGRDGPERTPAAPDRQRGQHRERAEGAGRPRSASRHATDPTAVARTPEASELLRELSRLAHDDD